MGLYSTSAQSPFQSGSREPDMAGFGMIMGTFGLSPRQGWSDHGRSAPSRLCAVRQGDWVVDVESSRLFGFKFNARVSLIHFLNRLENGRVLRGAVLGAGRHHTARLVIEDVEPESTHR